jgi:hypothetical protein
MVARRTRPTRFGKGRKEEPNLRDFLKGGVQRLSRRPSSWTKPSREQELKLTNLLIREFRSRNGSTFSSRLRSLLPTAQKIGVPLRSAESLRVRVNRLVDEGKIDKQHLGRSEIRGGARKRRTDDEKRAKWGRIRDVINNPKYQFRPHMIARSLDITPHALRAERRRMRDADPPVLVDVRGALMRHVYGMLRKYPWMTKDYIIKNTGRDRATVRSLMKDVEAAEQLVRFAKKRGEPLTIDEIFDDWREYKNLVESVRKGMPSHA